MGKNTADGGMWYLIFRHCEFYEAEAEAGTMTVVVFFLVGVLNLFQ